MVLKSICLYLSDINRKDMDFYTHTNLQLQNCFDKSKYLIIHYQCKNTIYLKQLTISTLFLEPSEERGGVNFQKYFLKMHSSKIITLNSFYIRFSKSNSL